MSHPAERVQYLLAFIMVGEGAMDTDADGNLFYKAGSAGAHTPIRHSAMPHSLDLELQWQVDRTAETLDARGARMALDASGNAIIAFGWTTGQEGGSSELVTAKYNVSGELLWEDRLVREEPPVPGKDEYFALHAGPMIVMPDGNILTETHWEGEGIHSHMLRTFAP